MALYSVKINTIELYSLQVFRDFHYSVRLLIKYWIFWYLRAEEYKIQLGELTSYDNKPYYICVFNSIV
jgi:hypothetical protein